MNHTQRALESLRYKADGFNLYRAGMSGAKNHKWGPVMRDLFLSAIIMDDANLLKESFAFACYTQGKDYDPITGEEPGRILHEWEDVFINNLSTKYNSLDSTLLFLIAVPSLSHKVLSESTESVSRAIRWLLKHIDKDGLFVEDPSLCGARDYALAATYWKDAYPPGNREIAYPVSFLLTQAQALKALRLFRRKEAERVKEALTQRFLVSPVPRIAIDARGEVSAFSSDILHCLYYLEPSDIERKQLFETTATALKTPVGFRTYAPTELDYTPRAYQKGSIWPFEQYFIAEGAKKHGLESIASVAECCSGFDGFPELINWEDGKIEALGHKLQLWTVAYKF